MSAFDVTTITTLEDMFDYAEGFIRRQGAPAIDDAGCTYLDTATGRRCAVGALMTENEARRSRGGVFKLFGFGALPERFIEFADALNQLQGAHDHAAADGTAAPRTEFLEGFVSRVTSLRERLRLPPYDGARVSRFFSEEAEAC